MTVYLFDNLRNAQLALDSLARALIPHGMCFAPSECALLCHDSNSSLPPLTLSHIRPELVNKLGYLSACMNNGGANLKGYERPMLTCIINAEWSFV